MTTSRYHEVYVHQTPRSSRILDDEIEVLTPGNVPEVLATSPGRTARSGSSHHPPRSDNRPPPTYRQSVIEMDDRVSGRLTGGEEQEETSHRTHSRTTSRDRAFDLPTYDEAIDPESAPPPTYDSLFGRVREARKSSKGLMDFAKNVLILILGTRE